MDGNPSRHQHHRHSLRGLGRAQSDLIPPSDQANPPGHLGSFLDCPFFTLQLTSAPALRRILRFWKDLPKPARPEEIVATASAKLPYSRRMISRLETMDDVWVLWRCEGRHDISRACDLSVGGMFLSTSAPPPVGSKAKLEFLVQEGQIRAEAVVRHHIPGGGLGLKFTAITDQDCPRLVALINRVRVSSSTSRRPSSVVSPP